MPRSSEEGRTEVPAGWNDRAGLASRMAGFPPPASPVAASPGQEGADSAAYGASRPPESGAAGGTVPDAERPAAEALFGDRLPLAERYADLLATDGVIRGLIGPREAPRLWERHLLNCAAVTELIPRNAVVADVGSGAGLPGLVLAIARPDLSVILVEPLARRTVFLAEAVDRLGLGARVRVFRGRAEEAVGRIPPSDVVTARAVAALDRLAEWCLPLARIGGQLLAVKGAAAAGEVATMTGVIHDLGGGTPEVLRCGVAVLTEPTTVVRVVRERRVEPERPAVARSSRASGRARGSGGRRRRG